MVVPELVPFPDVAEAVSQLARLLIEYFTKPLEALSLYLNVDGENGPPCGPEATMLVEGVSCSDCPSRSRH